MNQNVCYSELTEPDFDFSSKEGVEALSGF